MEEIGFYRKPQYITSFSRHMKQHQTPAEILLWNRLKAKQLCGYKFHRQKPLFAYRKENGVDKFFIADFYHHPSRLIIEIDGSIHNRKDVRDYDHVREYLLKDRGYRIVRFTNDMVMSDIEDVLKRIKENIVS